MMNTEKKVSKEKEKKRKVTKGKNEKK